MNGRRPTNADPFAATLRGRNGLADSILFSGHTLAGFPTGNLRTTVRTRITQS